MNGKPKTEILAPAGSAEQLIAAVNNGCDSVYLGLDCFNARMKAANFKSDNLAEWIDFCHLFGVKVYVALNTSLKNDEYESALKILADIYLKNADGVILTDFALISAAAQLPKPFDVVASTQLNVHDKWGATFLKKLGATTVVCARETSLKDIEDIVSVGGIKAECFIHGATCVCQSGQCLFSATVGGKSGNRGLCAQPCRKLYSANGKKFAYLLSARDLCGLDIAKKLYQAGVSVYKIEGRNRRAEYAGVTSKIYRKLFDNDFLYDASDRTQLAEMYNRDMATLSYIEGGNDAIISPNVNNHIGVYVGKVCKNGIRTDAEICKGDGFKLTERGKEVGGGVALESGTGVVAARFDGVVADGTEVRRTTSVRLCSEINSAKRTLNVSVKFVAKENEKATLTLSCGDVAVTVTSDYIVPKALKTPTSAQEIAQQLQKTGDLHYTICDIVLETGEIFLAKSQINALRRTALEQLQTEIIRSYNERFANRKVERDFFRRAAILTEKRKDAVPTLAVVCKNEKEATDCVADYVIYKPAILDLKAFEFAKDRNAFVDLPSFADLDYLQTLLTAQPCGIVCHNVGHVQLARELGLPYIAGGGLNIFNDFSAETFDDATTFVYSTELTLDEISRFRNQSGLMFIDGEIVMMKLVHCPYKAAKGYSCGSCAANTELVYSDEAGNKFYLRRRKDGRCNFELINGRKLSVVSKLNHRGRYLTDYDKSVVRHYKLLNEGVNDGYAEQKPYTKGRLFDGVE